MFVLALLGGAAFLPPPTFAVEPDVDSAAGSELPAPRDRPDFQTDDQTGASVLVPQAEVAPEVIVPEEHSFEPLVKPRL